MRSEDCNTLSWRHGIALVLIAALGVFTIVGSDGGDQPVVGSYQPLIIATEPSNVTVQVGGTAAFSVVALGSGLSYQWKRSDGGLPFIDIGGATGASFTLTSAQPADDGARMAVTVQDKDGVQATSASARLAVSSMPGTVFQDGEFQLADWSVVVAATPTQNGSTHSEEHVVTGGNPGAYRKMVHAMSPGPSDLFVLHTFQPVMYDPASQGQIYVIDFTEDRILLTDLTQVSVAAVPLIEQNGRHYTASDPAPFFQRTVWRSRSLAGLMAADFALADGPSCTAGESCPDFSASGPPIRFGFARYSISSAGRAAVSLEHGIDNWKVTVWRK